MKIINPQKSFCGWLHYVDMYGKRGVRLQLRLLTLRMTFYVWHLAGDVNKLLRRNPLIQPETRNKKLGTINH